ncbi:MULTISPECIES: hypothetical protein [unclassified Pseudomonas]|uniref:hypothetical protein n=1 Tax=unclassified Pseudomonas TaxID=196821 RepID=UPI000BE27AC9|nr:MULTISPECIES: hypothetical protein [unclassified Pseudomonas]
MADEESSLQQFYGAIEQHLQLSLPRVAIVKVWPVIGTSIPLPAIFIELAEFEPGRDPGTGETGLVCKMEARIVTDPLHADHHQQAVFLAGRLAVLLRMQTWGLEIEQAEFVQAMQDWTKPELDSYTVWLVEWTQQIYLGEEEWPWLNQPPGSLVWGFVPDTGPGGEGNYLPPEAME